MSEPPKRWEVILTRQPEKILRRLPKDLLKRIDKAILSLAENPRPPQCTRLKGYENLWRVKASDWRITYAIEDDRLVVLILEIMPRGGAYRSLRG